MKRAKIEARLRTLDIYSDLFCDVFEADGVRDALKQLHWESRLNLAKAMGVPMATECISLNELAYNDDNITPSGFSKITDITQTLLSLLLERYSDAELHDMFKRIPKDETR